MKKIIIALFIGIIFISCDSMAQNIVITNPPASSGPSSSAEDKLCDPIIKSYIEDVNKILTENDTEEIKIENKPQPSVAPSSKDGSTKGCFTPEKSFDGFPIKKAFREGLKSAWRQIVDIINDLAALGGDIMNNILENSILKNVLQALGAIFGFNIDCLTMIDRAVDATASYINVDSYISQFVDPLDEIPYLDVDVERRGYKFDFGGNINSDSFTSDVLDF